MNSSDNWNNVAHLYSSKREVHFEQLWGSVSTVARVHIRRARHNNRSGHCVPPIPAHLYLILSLSVWFQAFVIRSDGLCCQDILATQHLFKYADLENVAGYGSWLCKLCPVLTDIGTTCLAGTHYHRHHNHIELAPHWQIWFSVAYHWQTWSNKHENERGRDFNQS